MHACATHVCSAQGGAHKGIRCPGTEVTDGCEPPCGCWESTSNLLDEELGVLATESCLQPSTASYFNLVTAPIKGTSTSFGPLISEAHQFPFGFLLCYMTQGAVAVPAVG